MEEIDTKDFKNLFSNEMMADIINIFLAEAKHPVIAGCLERIEPIRDWGDYFLKPDAVVRWEDLEVGFYAVGIGSRKKVDYDLAPDTFMYEQLRLRYWLNHRNDNEKIFKFITFIINFDYKSVWKGPTTIQITDDDIWPNLPPFQRFKPLMDSFRLKIIDLAFLSDEKIDAMHGNFKILAKGLKEKNKALGWNCLFE